MRSRTEHRLSFSLTALSSCLLSQTLYAQVPQLAAEGELPQSPSNQSLFQTQPSGEAQIAASRDEGSEGDFLHRYKPQAGMVELGAFLGPVFISDNNSFRGPATANPGQNPTLMPYSQFKQPSFEFGLRGSYFPLSFLGGELEGMVAAASTDGGDGVTVLAGRAQLIVQSPFWSVVPFVVGGVGYWLVNNDYSGDDSDPAFHFGGGAKVNVASNVSLRLDVRDTVTNARAIDNYPNNVEVLVGGNLVLGRSDPAPKDSDRDGYVDEHDQCPLEAGTLPNGCPVRDTDADGIMDPDDQCVKEAGPAPTGCPVLDADLDGIADATDQCVSEKGVMPTGCPDGDLDGVLDRDDKCPVIPGVAPDGCLPDADQDGIVGADDRCPEQPETRNGFEDADGCPDELPAAVKNFMGVIAGIEFDTNKDSIRDSSQTVLERAVSVLTEYPSLRIQIVGHTDDKGAHDHNLDLSQRRAESVKSYFIARGIDPRRVESRGAGPDEPLGSNKTLAGRQKNRRIEFHVLQ